MMVRKNSNLFSSSEFSVCEIKHVDLKEVSRCHMTVFSDSFPTKLGRRYVKRMLEWYIVSEDRFLISTMLDGRVVGYVGGAKGAGSTSGMIQYAYWQGVFSIIIRPYLLFDQSIYSNLSLILRNIIRRITRSSNKSDLSKTKIPDNLSELSIGLIVIGVDPKHRRQGIGSVMLDAFVNKSKLLGAHYGHLSVDTDNQSAINTYKKNGWKIVSSDKNSTNMRKRIS